MRYLYTILRFLLFTVIVLISFSVWFVYTQQGRDFLAYSVNSVTFSSSITIQVKKINSIFPFHAEFSYLALCKNKEIWVEVENAEVNADIIECIKERKFQTKVYISHLLIKNVQDKGIKKANSITAFFDKETKLNFALDLNIDTLIAKGYVGDETVIIKGFQANAKYFNDFEFHLKGGITNFGEDLFFKGKAYGSLDNIRANFSLNSNYLSYDKYFVECICISGEFDGLLSNPKGTIVFKGNPMGIAHINAKANVAQIGKNIHIDLQEMNSNFLEVNNASIKLHTSTNDLYLKFKGGLKQHAVTNLYSIQGGKIDIEAKQVNKILSGKLELKTKSFNGFDSHFDELLLNASARDLSANGLGTFVLKAKGLSALGLKIKTLSFHGKFSNDKTVFHLDANGPEIEAVLSGKLQEKEEKKSLTIEKAEILYRKIRLGLCYPMEILICGKRSAIPMARFNIGGGTLSLSGMIDPFFVDLKINTNLSLEKIAPLLLQPEHFLEGDLNSDISIKGDLNSPNILGYIKITDGFYRNIEYGVYISDIQSQLNARGTQIDIASFQAKSRNGGDIRASGFIDTEIDKVDIKINGGDFKLFDSDIIEATLKEVSLQLSGSLSDLTCSGNIFFEKGKLDVGLNKVPKIKLLKECSRLKNSPKIKEKRELLPLLISLDINIESEPQFKVFGIGIDSIWSANMKIKGNTIKPLLEGKIKLARGFFKLLGTDLKLQEGSIVFSGAPENLPYITILGATQNSGYKIKVIIRGTPENLNFDFSSTPSLPRDNIISQLLFGKVSKDLTPFEAVKLAKSIEALKGGGLSTDIMGQISNALGFDFIAVDADQEKSEASVHIEKQFNDRVKFITDQSTDLQDSTVGVEVKVMDNIIVGATHGLIAPDENLSINYKLDY